MDPVQICIQACSVVRTEKSFEISLIFEWLSKCQMSAVKHVYMFIEIFVICHFVKTIVEHCSIDNTFWILANFNHDDTVIFWTFYFMNQAAAQRTMTSGSFRDQISSKCCVSFLAINSICRMFDQTNPHGLTFLQLYKYCFTQLIMTFVVSVQLSINFTIFNQLDVGSVTILL